MLRRYLFIMNILRLPGNDADEFAAINGFGEVVVTSGQQTLFAVPVHCVGGESDYGTAVSLLPENARGRVTVGDGHLHIHQNDVEWIPLLNGLIGVFDGLPAVFHQGRFNTCDF